MTPGLALMLAVLSVVGLIVYLTRVVELEAAERKRRHDREQVELIRQLRAIGERRDRLGSRER